MQPNSGLLGDLIGFIDSSSYIFLLLLVALPIVSWLDFKLQSSKVLFVGILKLNTILYFLSCFGLTLVLFAIDQNHQWFNGEDQRLVISLIISFVVLYFFRLFFYSKSNIKFSHTWLVCGIVSILPLVGPALLLAYGILLGSGMNGH